MVSHASETWDYKRLNIAKLVDKDGGVIELIEPIECWWDQSHIALEVDSLEEAAGMFAIRRQAREDDHVSVQYVEDDWGNVLELVEVKK